MVGIYAVLLYLIFGRLLHPGHADRIPGRQALAVCHAGVLKRGPMNRPRNGFTGQHGFPGFAFYHNRLFSNLLILGLLIDTLLRMLAPIFGR